jgi:hypothetical protein
MPYPLPPSPPPGEWSQNCHVVLYKIEPVSFGPNQTIPPYGNFFTTNSPKYFAFYVFLLRVGSSEIRPNRREVHDPSFLYVAGYDLCRPPLRLQVQVFLNNPWGLGTE